MYRIAVLAEQEAERQRYAEQITRFCEAKGLFPQVMQYDDQERFFETAQKEAPTNAVIALSGVAGLNAAEHLRSLCPACRMIWCSDLDFSLHAFRLRADYFQMKPVSEEAFSETAESTSDEVVMDVLAETEETVLTGTEDAAPVQADNKTVKAVETAKITLRIKSPRKNQGKGKAGTFPSRLSLQQRRRNMEHFLNDGSL